MAGDGWGWVGVRVRRERKCGMQEWGEAIGGVGAGEQKGVLEGQVWLTSRSTGRASCRSIKPSARCRPTRVPPVKLDETVQLMISEGHCPKLSG